MGGSKHKKKKRKQERNASPQNKKSKPSSKTQPAALSLASRLKRTRGTADSTPLPPPWSKQSTCRLPFLTPNDGEAFTSCQRECYRGFCWESPNELPTTLHSTFDQAFDALYEAGLFLYDVVQPGGKRLSRTFVTRTLLGNAGSTYRYLGLRLFSHPWTPVTDDGDILKGDDRRSLQALGYSLECAKALLALGELNASLIDRTQRALEQQIAPYVPDGLVGSAEFNLTLINRMEPTRTKKDLKQEKVYGLGKASVSWHKDSGLMDFSSIAVYHSLRDADDSSNEDGNPWQVALRVAGENKTPPLCVPLPSGSLYYLLDDLNHKHEHTVLAGSNKLRYSSTHRVAREGCGTWQYIRDKCRRILDTPKISCGSSLSERRKQFVKETRAEQQLLNEIEFEWLRQWYVQGQEHARLHPYWHRPMERLEGWFQDIEKRCLKTMKLLEESSRKDASQDSAVSEDVFDVLIEALEERSALRDTWRERLRDPVFKSMPLNMRPFSSPVLDRKSPDKAVHLPEDLKSLVANLRRWRKLFVKRIEKGRKERNVTSNSELTKKEKRKIASNWETMKASFSKKRK